MSDVILDQDDTLRSRLHRAEQRRSIRENLKPADVRADMAREWGVSFWTLTNVLRGRLTDLKGKVLSRVDAGIRRELLVDCAGVKHELYRARRCDPNALAAEILEAEAALEAAEALLRQRKSPAEGLR